MSFHKQKHKRKKNVEVSLFRNIPVEIDIYKFTCGSTSPHV